MSSPVSRLGRQLLQNGVYFLLERGRGGRFVVTRPRRLQIRIRGSAGENRQS